MHASILVMIHVVEMELLKMMEHVIAMMLIIMQGINASIVVQIGVMEMDILTEMEIVLAILDIMVTDAIQYVHQV